MRVSRILSCILLLLLAASLHVSALSPSARALRPHDLALVGAGSIPPLPQDAHSTTGPLRPPWVKDVDAQGAGQQASLDAVVIPYVPAYLWRHGCGPTAAGMVLGYWDRRGYDDLMPGDASTQTEAVQQMIASDGPASNFADYCEPLDASTPDILPDKSEDPPGDEHPDECVADYMRTSQSQYGMRYGWSWYSDIARSFQGYIPAASGGRYQASVTNLWLGSMPMLTWDIFRAEIDAGRPMVLLVDTDGSGGTDHFVTAIGYDDAGGARRYACLDTWGTSVRWADFAPLMAGQPWGIYGATLLRFLTPPVDVADAVLHGPTTARTGETCAFTAIISPTTATQPVTYVWQATDQQPITHTVNSISDTVAFAWNGPGAKSVTLHVSNQGGALITYSGRIIIDPLHLHMPLQRRP